MRYDYDSLVIGSGSGGLTCTIGLAESGKKVALDELTKSGRFDKKIITPIIPFTNFYPAEDYHQNYYRINPVRYEAYTGGSGRKEFLEKTWGKDLDYKISSQGASGVSSNTRVLTGSMSMDPQSLKSRLTPMQYSVTQEDGTEPPFDNEYWNNYTSEGICVDIVDGTPLYSSKDQYDSGTGWPSFTKPIAPENITTTEDNTLFSQRTEVRSKKVNSHLGHMFDDGPADTGGLRYCMNSAAMRFVKKENLEKEGYGEYLGLFR